MAGTKAVKLDAKSVCRALKKVQSLHREMCRDAMRVARDRGPEFTGEAIDEALWYVAKWIRRQPGTAQEQLALLREVLPNLGDAIAKALRVGCRICKQRVESAR